MEPYADEESKVFWGPVTAEELQITWILRRQDKSNNRSYIGEDSEMEMSPQDPSSVSSNVEGSSENERKTHGPEKTCYEMLLESNCLRYIDEEKLSDTEKKENVFHLSGAKEFIISEDYSLISVDGFENDESCEISIRKSTEPKIENPQNNLVTNHMITYENEKLDLTYNSSGLFGCKDEHSALNCSPFSEKVTHSDNESHSKLLETKATLPYQPKAPFLDNFCEIKYTKGCRTFFDELNPEVNENASNGVDLDGEDDFLKINADNNKKVVCEESSEALSNNLFREDLCFHNLELNNEQNLYAKEKILNKFAAMNLNEPNILNKDKVVENENCFEAILQNTQDLKKVDSKEEFFEMDSKTNKVLHNSNKTEGIMELQNESLYNESKYKNSLISTMKTNSDDLQMKGKENTFDISDKELSEEKSDVHYTCKKLKNLLCLEELEKSSVKKKNVFGSLNLSAIRESNEVKICHDVELKMKEGYIEKQKEDNEELPKNSTEKDKTWISFREKCINTCSESREVSKISLEDLEQFKTLEDDCNQLCSKNKEKSQMERNIVIKKHEAVDEPMKILQAEYFHSKAHESNPQHSLQELKPGDIWTFLDEFIMGNKEKVFGSENLVNGMQSGGVLETLQEGTNEFKKEAIPRIIMEESEKETETSGSNFAIMPELSDSVENKMSFSSGESKHKSDFIETNLNEPLDLSKTTSIKPIMQGDEMFLGYKSKILQNESEQDIFSITDKIDEAVLDLDFKKINENPSLVSGKIKNINFDLKESTDEYPNLEKEEIKILNFKNGTEPTIFLEEVKSTEKKQENVVLDYSGSIATELILVSSEKPGSPEIVIEEFKKNITNSNSHLTNEILIQLTENILQRIEIDDTKFKKEGFVNFNSDEENLKYVAENSDSNSVDNTSNNKQLQYDSNDAFNQPVENTEERLIVELKNNECSLGYSPECGELFDSVEKETVPEYFNSNYMKNVLQGGALSEVEQFFDPENIKTCSNYRPEYSNSGESHEETINLLSKDERNVQVNHSESDGIAIIFQSDKNIEKLSFVQEKTDCSNFERKFVHDIKTDTKVIITNDNEISQGESEVLHFHIPEEAEEILGNNVENNLSKLCNIKKEIKNTSIVAIDNSDCDDLRGVKEELLTEGFMQEKPVNILDHIKQQPTTIGKQVPSSKSNIKCINKQNEEFKRNIKTLDFKALRGKASPFKPLMVKGQMEYRDQNINLSPGLCHTSVNIPTVQQPRKAASKNIKSQANSSLGKSTTILAPSKLQFGHKITFSNSPAFCHPLKPLLKEDMENRKNCSPLFKIPEQATPCVKPKASSCSRKLINSPTGYSPKLKKFCLSSPVPSDQSKLSTSSSAIKKISAKGYQFPKQCNSSLTSSVNSPRPSYNQGLAGTTKYPPSSIGISRIPKTQTPLSKVGSQKEMLPLPSQPQRKIMISTPRPMLNPSNASSKSPFPIKTSNVQKFKATLIPTPNKEYKTPLKPTLILTNSSNRATTSKYSTSKVTPL